MYIEGNKVNNFEIHYNTIGAWEIILYIIAFTVLFTWKYKFMKCYRWLKKILI